jgi:hypothetical protein
VYDNQAVYVKVMVLCYDERYVIYDYDGFDYKNVKDEESEKRVEIENIKKKKKKNGE